MIDASFVGNINYVTRTIQTAKDLVLSIEDDIHDVKTLMQQNFGERFDKQQLLNLLELDNTQLKSQTEEYKVEIEALRTFLTNLEEEKAIQLREWEEQFDSLEKNMEQLQAENEEKNEKLLLYESEIERTVKQCDQAFKEKEDMFSKAKELDEYCNQVEAQVTLYHTQATTLQAENEQLQRKIEDFERLLQENKQTTTEQQQAILEQHQEEVQDLYQQITTLRSQLQHLTEQKERIEQTLQRNQQEYQDQYQSLFQKYQQQQQQSKELLDQAYQQRQEEQRDSQRQLQAVTSEYHEHYHTQQQKYQQLQEDFQRRYQQQREDLLQQSQRQWQQQLQVQELRWEQEKQLLQIQHQTEITELRQQIEFLKKSQLTSHSISSPIDHSSPRGVLKKRISFPELSDSEVVAASLSLDPSHLSPTGTKNTHKKNRGKGLESQETALTASLSFSSASPPLPAISHSLTFSHDDSGGTAPSSSAYRRLKEEETLYTSADDIEEKEEEGEVEAKKGEKKDVAHRGSRSSNLTALKPGIGLKDDAAEDDRKDDGDDHNEYKNGDDHAEESFEEKRRVVLSPNRTLRNSLSHEVNFLEIVEEDEQAHIIHAASSDDILRKAREEYNTNRNVSDYLTPTSSESSPLPTASPTRKKIGSSSLNPFDEFDNVSVPETVETTSSVVVDAFGYASQSGSVEKKKEVVEMSKTAEQSSQDDYDYEYEGYDDDDFDAENIQLSDILNLQFN